MSPSLLICDDEIHILCAAEIKFRHAGYEVRVASDGLEGWAAIEARRPDMLITDYQMPRLDGLGLIRRIRETPATADLPIIMLTAKGFELSHEEVCQRWSLTAIIAKPFSPRELLRRVNEILLPAAASS